MSKYSELRQLVIDLESDTNKVLQKNNSSAGIRVRKNLQLVKALAQQLREEIAIVLRAEREKTKTKRKLKELNKTKKTEDDNNYF